MAGNRPFGPKNPMQATPLQIGCKEGSESQSRETSSWARNNLAWLQEMLPGSHSLFLFDCNSQDAAVLCGSYPATAQLNTAISAVVDSCRNHQHPAYVHQNTQTQSMAKQYSMLCIHLTLGKQKEAYRLVIVGNELNEVQRKTAIHLIQWASQRFELDDQATSDNSSKPVEPTTSPASQLSLSMLSALSQHGDTTALAFTLVNSLVRLCGCARVSLAHCDNGKLTLLAMSGQASIDKRRDLARSLLSLMRETVDAQAVLYPQPENAHDLPAHEYFHKEHGQHSIMSFCFAETPFDQFVIVLERGKAHFEPTQLQTIMAMVEAPGALLQTQYQTQSSTTQKFKRAIRQRFVNWNRISQWSAKRTLWVSSIAALALLCVLPVKHRVSTTAFIDAADRQVLVAPEDGFILSAHARAGDFVEKGALLATLDTRELSLSADKWLSEKTKNDQAYAKALAVHDRIELSRLRADAQRIDAELNLVQQKLRRSEIRAPFNGVLLTGDWTQALGAPVGLGDVLFELASTEQYRLILEVDEHDVSYIQPGQMADLRMASLPGSSFKAELEAVMPVAVSEQGRSAFQITAVIDGGANKLRPGMQGVGKVLIGERSLLWVYTHKMVELVQYYAWKLGLL